MRQRLLCLALLLASTACTTVDGVPADPADLVLRNVTVIDPERETRTARQDVFIDSGRIVAVVRSGSSRRAADKTIDATGKFVMPGLMDMHSHTSLRPIHVSSLKLMTANGITGVREMGSDCMQEGKIGMCIGEMRESQARIASGEMVGPRILELSSLKIASDRPEDANEVWKLHRPTNAEQARETVAGLAGRRPDILKTGDQLNAESLRALTIAARERGIKVGGHLPATMSVAEAAAAGMTSIEHARDLPLDCSTFGARYRAEVLAQVMAQDSEKKPDRSAMPAKARDGFNEQLCATQIAAMRKHGTYYVPTHLTREMDYRAGEADYRKDARLAYVPAVQQRMWNRDLDKTAEATPQLVSDLGDFFRLGLKTTGMAHSAGVKVMTGTDSNDTMVFPGFSLHDELRHLVAAGLTPMEALQAATSVPAEYLGRTGDFGGVSKGKLADLLLLSADPTIDIANTTRIAAVIQSGVVRDRAALDALLAKVKAWVVQADAEAAARK